jgi:putative DNA primase/helicase
VYDALRGIASIVKIVPLPGIPNKGDVSDWIAAGGTREQFECIVAATVTTTAPEETISVAPREEEHHDLVLDRGAPLQTAREFLKSHYTVGGVPALHYQGGSFYPYNGTCFPETDGDGIRAEVYKFLEPAKVWSKDQDKGLVDFRPNRATVGDAIDALKAITILPPGITPPAWIKGEGPTPASVFIVCRNGLLHLPTNKIYPHNPMFYTHNALSFDFDPYAEYPTEWHKFMDSIFANDQELRSALQMMLGYFLNTDTKHEKIFLIVGPRRGGKGTIARVIAHLIGRDNIAAPTLALLGQHFGLTHLIDKQVAIVSDARLGKYTDQSIIAERLLSISGEDNLTIPRKYATDWTGRLYSRFLILTNEIPKINDSSGALPSRFIVFNLAESFLGREDHELENKLIRELPGILNWAIGGWRLLQEAGRFAQPASALDAVRELEDLSSPIGAFIREECVVECGATVKITDILAAWKAWCLRHGWDRTTTVQSFGRDLRAARQGIKSGQQRAEGDRDRCYFGIRLKKQWE